LAKDKKPLFTIFVQGHEGEHSRLLLNSAKFTSPVAHDPALAVIRNEHLRAIFTAFGIAHGDSTLHLLQQPSKIFFAAFAFHSLTCNVSIGANENQNASCRLLNL